MYEHNFFNTRFIKAQIEKLNIAIVEKPEISQNIKLYYFGCHDDYIFCEYLRPTLDKSQPCERKALMEITRVLINESCDAYNELLITGHYSFEDKSSNNRQILEEKMHNCLNLNFVIYLLVEITHAFSHIEDMGHDIQVSESGVRDDFIYAEYFHHQFSDFLPCVRKALMQIIRVIINATSECCGKLKTLGYLDYQGFVVIPDELK